MYRYLVTTIRKPEFQPSVIEKHYTFLEQLRQHEKLELAGPFTDKSGGAYLLRAHDFEEARSLARRAMLCANLRLMDSRRREPTRTATDFITYDSINSWVRCGRAKGAGVRMLFSIRSIMANSLGTTACQSGSA